MKKVSELCILCGVVACAIVYSPNESEPIFFPPSRSEVEEILLRFERAPEMEKNRKMVNQGSYLKERATKHNDQLRKNLKKNREMQMNHFLHQIHRAAKPYNEFAHTELHGLRFYIEERWRECRRRIQFFQQVIGEPLPPPPARILGGHEEMEQARGHNAMQRDRWSTRMMKNDQHVTGSSGTDKGKAVLHAYEGSSSKVDGRVASYGHLRSSIQGTEATLFHGNMGGESGVYDFGMPQGQAGDAGEGQSALVPHGVTGGVTDGYGLGPYHGNDEATGFGHRTVFPHGELGGGGNGYDIGKHDWNAEGMGTRHDFLLPYQDIGRSNWIYSMNPRDLNIGNGKGGHSLMPLQGGIQGSEEGYTWRQQDWNAWATDTGYGTVFPNPYGDVGSGSGVYGKKQYDWNAVSTSGGYGMTVSNRDAAASTDAYGRNLHPMNADGTSSGLGMMLPRGEGRSNNGGYKVDLNQGNPGGASTEHQGTLLIPGDGGGNNFSTGLYPGDPMSIEEPHDPWAPYYSAAGSSRASNLAQKPGEEKRLGK